MISLTAKILNKDYKGARINDIVRSLINSSAELSAIVQTSASKITPFSSGMFTMGSFIKANEILLQYDLDVLDDQSLIDIASKFWGHFIVANDWSTTSAKSSDMRQKNINAMPYIIIALAKSGAKARYQGMTIETVIERYSNLDWRKATEKWCAITILLSDTQEQLINYIYSAICLELNLPLTNTEINAYELTHGFVSSFWNVMQMTNINPLQAIPERIPTPCMA